MGVRSFVVKMAGFSSFQLVRDFQPQVLPHDAFFCLEPELIVSHTWSVDSKDTASDAQRDSFPTASSFPLPPPLHGHDHSGGGIPVRHSSQLLLRLIMVQPHSAMACDAFCPAVTPVGGTGAARCARRGSLAGGSRAGPGLALPRCSRWVERRSG